MRQDGMCADLILMSTKMFFFCREEPVSWQVVKAIMLTWLDPGQSWDYWLSVQTDKCKKVRDGVKDVGSSSIMDCHSEPQN